jgi:hypothetical protein
LVVACDWEKGGTWSGAVEALRKEISPVLVWTGPGAGEGNQFHVDRGAISVDDTERLFPLSREASDSVKQPPSRQLALGL